ncbi:uncharacterized protein LOC128211679 [Mya arenaria]|uniref:uncharacterized protein LOC128211679 n=1 Tax=Mya arenaria TaxID=6604 RepID=UPI0022E7ED9D|nr:uncharacterized protein LOC128211679 [Mya arenaria]
MALTLLVIFLCTGLTVYCSPDKRAAVPTFAQGHVEATVTASSIREASGVCASRQHADVLYTHNDSGDTHRIFAISAKTGALLNTITIDGATAQDWEDIACGKCTGGSGNCVYIGDLGGNAGGDANTIFRIHEPATLNRNGGNIHVHADGTLKFSWDQNNCETLMVDPKGEVYVLSKVGTGGKHPKLVHLPDSAWTAHHRVQVNEGIMIPHTHTFVGGDISPNGQEVLVKDHSHIYYWHVNNGNYYETLRTQEPSQVPYHVEPQGEAVAWDKDGSGYYTISEGQHPKIYYYRRTSAPVVG